MTPDPEAEAVHAVARRSRQAARALALLTRERKDAALTAMADHLLRQSAFIVEANAGDVADARAAGTASGTLDRLTLTEDRMAALVGALRDLAALEDPVGEVIRGWTRPNGLRIRQVRVPIGVVGMIYEARPNVTVDAAGLCLKSGNAALLRGSSSALRTNEALVAVMREALADCGITPDAIALVPGAGHEAVRHLMAARGLVDVLIPRGGASLISSVVAHSQVPVIETGVGNCHVYVDSAVDLAQAVPIVVNAKAQRPSVCNAAETLLIHAGVLAEAGPVLLAALAEAGVHIHGDERVRPYAEQAGAQFSPVTDEDWAAEYYSLDLAVGVVDSLTEAIEHIARWGTGHTEAILTTSLTAADRFIAEVDAAAVIVNASTRFTDGGEFGFGAEIGISTQRLHARGPMGLTELTTTTSIVYGEGQIRG